MNRPKSPRARVLGIASVLGFASIASQATAAYFSTDFTRLGSPTNVVATLSFEDIGTDEVLVTLFHDPDSHGFITDLWFNLEPYGMYDQSEQSPAVKFDGPIQLGENAFSRLGYEFDARQEFNTRNNGGGTARLRPGESITFVLSGEGLDAADFWTTAINSTGRNSDVLAMIRMQGGYRMGGRSNGGNGGFIAAAVVPEPATIGILSFGLLPLLRRRKKQLG